MKFSGTQKILLEVLIGLIIFGIATYMMGLNLLLEGILVCIIGILAICWFNLWQNRRIINVDVLKPIDMKVLNGKAFLWGSSLENLKKIVLFKLPFQQHSKRKYILLFEFDTSTTEGQGSKGTFDGHTWFDKNYPLKDDFIEVYKGTPPDDFIEEWLVTTELEKEFRRHISIVLYDKKHITYRLTSQLKTATG